MKKVTILAAMALSLALASCKKADRTCVCSMAGVEVATLTIVDATSKAEANAVCSFNTKSTYTDKDGKTETIENDDMDGITCELD